MIECELWLGYKIKESTETRREGATSQQGAVAVVIFSFGVVKASIDSHMPLQMMLHCSQQMGELYCQTKEQIKRELPKKKSLSAVFISTVNELSAYYDLDIY